MILKAITLGRVLLAAKSVSAGAAVATAGAVMGLVALVLF
jgi:hypothetical protein